MTGTLCIPADRDLHTVAAPHAGRQTAHLTTEPPAAGGSRSGGGGREDSTAAAAAAAAGAAAHFNTGHPDARAHEQYLASLCQTPALVSVQQLLASRPLGALGCNYIMLSVQGCICIMLSVEIAQHAVKHAAVCMVWTPMRG